MSSLFRRTAFAGALYLLSPLLSAPSAAADRPNPDNAPAEPADPAVLETITITADPFARTADRLTRPVEVLVGEELDRRRGATLGETLEHELGVSSTDFGRGAGRPVIRGQGGPRVLLLQNGIASADASDVSADHDVSIDPAHAEQIEILKGPATLIYGSGAAAGVVNVVDGRLPGRVSEGLRANLGTHAGSNADEFSGSGKLGFGFGGTQLGVSAAYFDADDYDIAGNSATDGSGARGELPNSAVEKKSGSVSVGQFWDRGSVAASYERYQTVYGLPVEEAAFIDLEQDRIDVEGRLTQPLRGLESARLRLSRGAYEHTEFEEPGVAGTRFVNDQTETRLELVHAPLADFRGVFGVQYRDREFQAIGEEAFVPPSDTRSLGVFLVERKPMPFGELEFGLRTDRDESEPQVSGLRQRAFTPLSLSAGALVELGDHYHLKFFATRSERSPVTEELYSFGPHAATSTFERGNDGFDPETASNFEISLDRHGGPLNWRVNLFYENVADYLFQREADAGLNADGSGVAAADGVADRVNEEGAFDPDGELLLLDYDAADARFWGAEAEVSQLWSMGATEVTARVFGDLVRGSLRDDGDLPRITPARLGLGLHAHRGAWNATLDYTRVQQQDRIAALETATGGYSLLGVDLEYALPLQAGALSLFLRGRNLLDEEARRHTSFIKDFAPLPGASVLAGLEWRIE